MQQVIESPGLRSIWKLWCAVLILGVCETDWLFAAQPGLNWPLSTLAIAVSLMLCRSSAGKCFKAQIAIPLALACVLAAGATLTSDSWNQFLIGTATLLALCAAVLTEDLGWQRVEGGAITWVAAVPYTARIVVREAFRRCVEARHNVRDRRAAAIMRGVLLAFPVVVLLALLLSQADPTFAALRDLIDQVLKDFSFIPRLLFCCLLMICLLGAFGMALQSLSGDVESPESRQTSRRLIGDIERLIILGSIASLFAIFLILQVSYLFGDPGGRIGSGVSYAEAVHRGFAELNVASSICGVLLLLLARHADSGSHRRLLKVLEWTVIIQAQILLISAFYRVNLYEAAYGFTRSRLQVQIYAVVAFIMLALLTIELQGYPLIDRLIRRSLLVAALAFVAPVYANSDAWIARANLQRYVHTRQLDVPYLTYGLGPDAVPELATEMPFMPAPVGAHILACLQNRYAGQEKVGPTRWFEWNPRRSALNRTLSEMSRSELRRDRYLVGPQTRDSNQGSSLTAQVRHGA